MNDDNEQDVIDAIWDVFAAGGSKKQARLLVCGRRVYIAQNPRITDAQRQQIAAEIERGTRIDEVQQRFQRSRATIYRIKRKLGLG